MKKITTKLALLFLISSFGLKAFAELQVTLPAYAGTINNFTTIPNEALTVSFELDARYYLWNPEVCHSKFRGPYPLSTNGEFHSDKMSVLTCASWNRDFEATGRLKIDFSKTSHPVVEYTNIIMETFDFKNPPKSPLEASLIEIPAAILPIEVSDGSDPKKWVAEVEKAYIVDSLGSDITVKIANEPPQQGVYSDDFDLEYNFPFDGVSSFQLIPKILLRQGTYNKNSLVEIEINLYAKGSRRVYASKESVKISDLADYFANKKLIVSPLF